MKDGIVQTWRQIFNAEYNPDHKNDPAIENAAQEIAYALHNIAHDLRKIRIHLESRK